MRTLLWTLVGMAMLSTAFVTPAQALGQCVRTPAGDACAGALVGEDAAGARAFADAAGHSAGASAVLVKERGVGAFVGVGADGSRLAGAGVHASRGGACVGIGLPAADQGAFQCAAVPSP